MMRKQGNRQKQDGHSQRPDQPFYNPGSAGTRKSSHTSRVATMALKDALKIGFGKKSPTNDTPAVPVQQNNPPHRCSPHQLNENVPREVPKNTLRFPIGPPDIKTKGFELMRIPIVSNRIFFMLESLKASSTPFYLIRNILLFYFRIPTQ